MAVIVRKAAYFEQVSKSLGTSPAGIKSGERMVDLLLDERSDLVDIQEVEQTRNTEGYRMWHRISGVKYDVRTIVEYWADASTGDVIMLLHVIVPRRASTYNEVEDLWKQYRQKA